MSSSSVPVESSAVKVVVRLRPMNDMEKQIGVTPAVSASSEQNTVTVLKGQGFTRATYSFDNVFTGFASQEEVFQESLLNIIEDVIKGYTSTILAYGQTGTGKTHTMEGDLSTPYTYGVIPRSLDVIFQALKGRNVLSNYVTCSYLEIYNEELSDLLAYNEKNTKLDIFKSNDGTCVRGLVEKEVKTADDVLELLHHAVQSRKIGETKMNKQSSRSHCIFTVHVYSQCKSPEGTVVDFHGKLNLVDLAGSECAKNASGSESRSSVTGHARERERMNINRSLLTLGRVISAVKDRSQGGKIKRVPYRDSKLTRILQDAIGGRSKTVIIATVSPSEMAVAESLSTLNYAQAASSIVNKPLTSAHHVSQYMDGSRGLNGNHSVEQWFELECKLKYMEAQVEEAQATLARKHQQQQLLVDKANRCEDIIIEKEQLLGLANQKIDQLGMELEDERQTSKMKIEELIIELEEEKIRSEEQMQEMLAQMNEQKDQYEAEMEELREEMNEQKNQYEAEMEELRKEMSEQKKKFEMEIDALQEELREEKEHSQALTQSLKRTEASLKRTNAVLAATQQTEQDLTKEGQLLIDAVEVSIKQGDEMHELLLKNREHDMERKSASSEFQNAAAAVLGDIAKKMESVIEEEDNFCKSLVQENNEYGKTERQSLERTVQALKEINTNVKSVARVIKDLCTEEDGIIPSTSSAISAIHTELSGSKTVIGTGKEYISLANQGTKNRLESASEKMKNMNAKNNEDASDMLSSLMSRSNAVKQEIADAVSILLKSMGEITAARTETRLDLSGILEKSEAACLELVKEIGSRAVHQHTKLNNDAEQFNQGMKHLDEARDDLGEQKSYLDEKLGIQREDLTSQMLMLSNQQASFKEAHERQRQMYGEMMSSIMNGVQELVSSEFSRLSAENDDRLKAFETDNQMITLVHKNIEQCTNDFATQVGNTNESLSGHVESLFENDKNMLANSREASSTLYDIKGIAKKQHYMIGDTGKSLREKLDALANLDEPLEKSLDEVENRKNIVTASISQNIMEFAQDGVEKIIQSGTETFNYFPETVIPDILNDLEKNKSENDKMADDLLRHIENVQEVSENAQQAIQSTSQKQCRAIDELQHSVTSRCSDFHQQNILVRNKAIENRHNRVIERADEHLKASTNAIHSTRNLSQQVDDKINIFCKGVLLVDEPTEEVIPRGKVDYSTNLSSTPDERTIFDAMQLKEVDQDENVYPSSPPKFDTRDDVPVSDRTPSSPLSQISGDASHSPQSYYETSSPKKLILSGD